MKKRMLILSIGLLVFSVMAGCVSTDSTARTNQGMILQTKDISFRSEPGTLAVTNNTSKDVVVFAGAVEKKAILGGIIKGQRRSFNLAKLNGIPKNGSLLIRVATMDSYKNSASISKDDVIYTGLVVYDLDAPRDIQELTIYENIDVERKHCLYLANKSNNFVLQVRLGKPEGRIIATLAPNEDDKQVFLSPKTDKRGYALYPQFVYVDPRTNEMTSINVPGKEDVQTMYPEPAGGPLRLVSFDEPKKNNLSYSLAFLTVHNDTKAGMEFRNSTEILESQKGRRFTAPGDIDVYELNTGKGEEGRLYTQLSCFFNQYNEKRIGRYTFKPGFMYELHWSDENGNYQYDIREVGPKSFVEGAKIQLFMEND